MTSEELAKAQDLFRIGPRNPLHLRALNGLGRPQNLSFTADDFPDVGERWEALYSEAGRLNGNGYNVYTCLNPVKATFSEGAVRDNDIECRLLLLIDLDRSESADCPASEIEVKEALAISERIEDALLDQTGDTPVRMMSGNGIHLYYRLADLPNCRAETERCRKLLRGLSENFSTATIKVDTTVSNAGRITKLPYSIARKGAESEDRRYREAVIL